MSKARSQLTIIKKKTWATRRRRTITRMPLHQTKTMTAMTTMCLWTLTATRSLKWLAMANLTLKWTELVTSRSKMSIAMTRPKSLTPNSWRTSRLTATSSKRSTASTCNTWRVTSNSSRISQLVWLSSSLSNSRNSCFCRLSRLLSRESLFARSLASIAAS